MDGFKNFVIFLLFQYFSSFLCAEDSIKRQVHTESLHPDITPGNITVQNLFHTVAVGPDDTLHYITTTYGFPSILVAKTDNKATIKVDWNHFFSDNITETGHSIKFSTPPQYVYGIAFLQLIEFDDIDDNANLSAANANTTLKYTLSSGIPWANASVESRLEDNVIVLKIEQNYTDTSSGRSVIFMPGGSFSLKIQINNETSREANLPHLQQTANTSHIDVIIDHMKPVYANTRYAMEILYVTSTLQTYNSSIQLHKHHSIDDEHTPGVFQIIDLSANITPSSFLQWKPVCYKSENRAMKSGTKVKDYPLVDGDNILASIQGDRGLLYAYMGEDLYDSHTYDVTGMNVSFGLSQDKFYSHTLYTAWSFALGYGEAPPEELSFLIIIIISVGLGIPVLLIMFGSLGACIHRKKRKTKETSGSYTAIN